MTTNAKNAPSADHSIHLGSPVHRLILAEARKTQEELQATPRNVKTSVVDKILRRNHLLHGILTTDFKFENVIIEKIHVAPKTGDMEIQVKTWPDSPKGMGMRTENVTIHRKRARVCTEETIYLTLQGAYSSDALLAKTSGKDVAVPRKATSNELDLNPPSAQMADAMGWTNSQGAAFVHFASVRTLQKVIQEVTQVTLLKASVRPSSMPSDKSLSASFDNCDFVKSLFEKHFKKKFTKFRISSGKLWTKTGYFIVNAYCKTDEDHHAISHRIHFALGDGTQFEHKYFMARRNRGIDTAEFYKRLLAL